MNQSWEMDLEVVEVGVLELEIMEKSKIGLGLQQRGPLDLYWLS